MFFLKQTFLPEMLYCEPAPWTWNQENLGISTSGICFVIHSCVTIFHWEPLWIETEGVSWNHLQVNELSRDHSKMFLCCFSRTLFPWCSVLGDQFSMFSQECGGQTVVQNRKPCSSLGALPHLVLDQRGMKLKNVFH